MNKINMTDIFGNIPNVGDKVAYAESWGSSGYLRVGTISKITDTQIIIHRDYSGVDSVIRDSNEVHRSGIMDVIKYPRKHCKFVILNAAPDDVIDITSTECYPDYGLDFKFTEGKRYLIPVYEARVPVDCRFCTYSKDGYDDVINFICNGRITKFKYYEDGKYFLPM